MKKICLKTLNYLAKTSNNRKGFEVIAKYLNQYMVRDDHELKDTDILCKTLKDRDVYVSYVYCIIRTNILPIWDLLSIAIERAERNPLKAVIAKMQKVNEKDQISFDILNEIVEFMDDGNIDKASSILDIIVNNLTYSDFGKLIEVLYYYGNGYLIEMLYLTSTKHQITPDTLLHAIRQNRGDSIDFKTLDKFFYFFQLKDFDMGEFTKKERHAIRKYYK